MARFKVDDTVTILRDAMILVGALPPKGVEAGGSMSTGSQSHSRAFPEFPMPRKDPEFKLGLGFRVCVVCVLPSVRRRRLTF